MGRAHFWSDTEVQQVWAVKCEILPILEVTVVIAVFEEDCAIVGSSWLVTESDWPHGSSIWDNGTDSKHCSTGILVLFKVDTRVVDFLRSKKVHLQTSFSNSNGHSCNTILVNCLWSMNLTLGNLNSNNLSNPCQITTWGVIYLLNLTRLITLHVLTSECHHQGFSFAQYISKVAEGFVNMIVND
jgi:hypothetical protein